MSCYPRGCCVHSFIATISLMQSRVASFPKWNLMPRNTNQVVILFGVQATIIALALLTTTFIAWKCLFLLEETEHRQCRVCDISNPFISETVCSGSDPAVCEIIFGEVRMYVHATYMLHTCVCTYLWMNTTRWFIAVRYFHNAFKRSYRTHDLRQFLR